MNFKSKRPSKNKSLQSIPESAGAAFYTPDLYPCLLNGTNPYPKLQNHQIQVYALVLPHSPFTFVTRNELTAAVRVPAAAV
jgi:hypothetical protein